VNGRKGQASGVEPEPRLRVFGVPITLTQKTFGRTIIAAVSLGFAAVFAAGVIVAVNINRTEEYSRQVEHTFQVETALAGLAVVYERTETARRGYMLTRDPAYRTIFEQSLAQMPAALDRLEKLTNDNPRQQARLAEAKAIQGPYLDALRRSIELVTESGPEAALRAFRNDDTSESIRRSRTLLGQMMLEEAVLLRERDERQKASQRTLYLTLWIAGPLLVLVAAGSTLVIIRYARQLTEAGEAVRRQNENLEAAVSERTADLARANDEIQRFAYIVSHDLRSPLVNVMGFTAELDAVKKPLASLIETAAAKDPSLVTAEARAAVETDIPEAIRFIRTSTQKMDRLITAILDLSRSGRRTLKPEPLDMNQVFESIAATLKTRADEAGAQIVIKPGAPDLVADRLAVEQVFANLAENAIKYAKPGRPGMVELAGETVGDRCVFTVSDNGRGIDPRDHERIFELFRRSGVQDRPGEGIGLANVRAIVYRLGGTITCDSALDQGSVFKVSLPTAASSGA